LIENKAFKSSIYQQFARIGKAISNSNRLELLDLISQGEKTVDSLAKETGLSVANVSQHLQVLRGSRLVESEKQGHFAVYRLSDRIVNEFLLSMRKLAENRLAEVEQIARKFFESREGIREIDKNELLRMIREKEVILLDVRPPEEYRAGHIPGALSVPLEELESRISDLPQDEKIVAYCRGPYCVLAVEAVLMLRSKGYRAIRLEESVMDWKAMGLPIASGV